MKKPLILLFSSALLLSSCGTYTGSGAYVGGSFGSILGSAIGGIAVALVALILVQSLVWLVVLL